LASDEKWTFELNTGQKVIIEAYECGDVGLEIEGVGRMKMKSRDLIQLTNILNHVMDTIGRRYKE